MITDLQFELNEFWQGFFAGVLVFWPVPAWRMLCMVLH